VGKTHNKNCTKQQSRVKKTAAPAAAPAAPSGNPAPAAAQPTGGVHYVAPEPQFFDLDVQIEGQGRVELNGDPFVDSDRGKVEGQGRSPKNVTLTLRAVPPPGYQFVGWRDDSEVQGDPKQIATNPALIILMNRDRTITAKFEQDKREKDRADKSSSYAARVAARFKR
jgi:uncharacterized repeat protein (TIGR02543 family)